MRKLGITMVVCACLGLAACGGDDDPAPSSGFEVEDTVYLDQPAPAPAPTDLLPAPEENGGPEPATLPGTQPAPTPPASSPGNQGPVTRDDLLQPPQNSGGPEPAQPTPD